MKFSCFFVFGRDAPGRIIRTAKSINRSSRSNILLSFDIHYSLFDILRFKLIAAKVYEKTCMVLIKVLTG